MSIESNKELYRKLCETEGSTIPLFLQYWWMDTVCADKQWDVFLAYDSDGSIAGALPFLLGSKLGLHYIVQPQLTQFNGPWLRPCDDLPYRLQLQRRQEICLQLISQLQTLGVSYYNQNCPPSFSDWLPFHWNGFSQSTRYTYVYPDISDTAALLDRMSQSERHRKIERVLSTCVSTDEVSPSLFAKMHNDYCQRKGSYDLIPAALIERVCSTALANGHGLIAGLKDSESGQLLGAAFAVFDDRWGHYLMHATTGDDRSGLGKSLIWNLVVQLSGKTASFNFEGSMDRGLEYFYRSFGAEQVQYFNISKTFNPLFGLLLKMRR